MEMFAANLREALQEGVVPNITLFQQLAATHDQRHYDFFPEVIMMAATVYRDMVNRYLFFSKQHHGMSDNHLIPMDTLARDTHRQAMGMVESYGTTAKDKAQAATVRLDTSIKLLRDQVIQYKGNPAALTMPFLMIPRIAPGDVASLRDQTSSANKVESIAREQLSRAGDRLGSGSARSSQWLQLIREYRQAILNRDAILKSFNSPADYILESVSH